MEARIRHSQRVADVVDGQLAARNSERRTNEPPQHVAQESGADKAYAHNAGNIVIALASAGACSPSRACASARARAGARGRRCGCSLDAIPLTRCGA